MTTSAQDSPNAGRPSARFTARIAARLLRLDALDDLAARARPAGEADRFQAVLDAAGLGFTTDENAQARIPTSGPVIVAANHPFGLAEGIVLQAFLRRRRHDVKFIANAMLGRWPILEDHIIPVDPFGGEDAAKANVRGLKQAHRWLAEGGVLGIFPAGEVAHYSLARRRIVESRWNEVVHRLAVRAQATVVPIHIAGRNSALFHVAGFIRPELRTALLPRELLNKRNRSISFRVGRPIEATRMAGFETSERAMSYLRERCFQLAPSPLASRDDPPSRALAMTRMAARRLSSPVVMQREIDRLGARERVAACGGLSAYVATASAIPAIMGEIGRLREVTFRGVGEGSGRRIDLDRFDRDYLHLFIWNQERAEVVGAYRITPTVDGSGAPRLGRLYTQRLFGFDRRLLERIGPALELGRSFVRVEYQNDYSPLLLLWKGIGGFLSRNRQYRSLIGAVSISQRYRIESRELIVSYLEDKCRDRELSRLVRPRTPFRFRRPGAWSPRRLGVMASDLRELDGLIEDLEPDGSGIPVLWRHYLKLGARVVGFNLDPNFSNSLDGLIVVDLDRVPVRMLERYMGRNEARTFLGGRPTRGEVAMSN